MHFHESGGEHTKGLGRRRFSRREGKETNERGLAWPLDEKIFEEVRSQELFSSVVFEGQITNKQPIQRLSWDQWSKGVGHSSNHGERHRRQEDRAASNTKHQGTSTGTKRSRSQWIPAAL